MICIYFCDYVSVDVMFFLYYWVTNFIIIDAGFTRMYIYRFQGCIIIVSKENSTDISIVFT